MTLQKRSISSGKTSEGSRTTRTRRALKDSRHVQKLVLQVPLTVTAIFASARTPSALARSSTSDSTHLKSPSGDPEIKIEASMRATRLSLQM